MKNNERAIFMCELDPTLFSILPPTMSPIFFFLLLLLLLLLPLSLSQQYYEVNNAQLDCYDPTPPSSSVLGYSCNSLPSCPAFLTFRSLPSSSPISISSFLNTTNTTTNDLLLLLPINCSCTHYPTSKKRISYYHHPTTYTLLPTSTFQLIANDSFQGLSTCQAIAALNPSADSRHLVPGTDITVPLRCACPTRNQTSQGARYLITYLVTWGDDIPSISRRFGADPAAVRSANTLADDDVIYPFTTLLIPVSGIPSLSPSPPPPPLPPPPPPPANGSDREGIYIGVGVGVAVLLGGLVGWYYFCCIRRRRRSKQSARQMFDELPAHLAGKKMEEGSSRGYANSDTFDGASEIRGFIESLSVYKFADLEKATGFFGEAHRIKGAVYRGVVNGDLAAVKRMKGDVTSEIRILKRINHSNVVRLSGFCVHEGDTYLVYEFAEKGSLADWIHHPDEDWSSSECVLQWRQRVRIAYDVADGLNYLHNYTNPPLIHKNLKSSNILLDGEFRAKLANFGLARPVDEEEVLQLTRHVVGTQGYLAPEYLEHGLVSMKLDVFAFGVVILELLTGKEATFARDGDEKGEILLWAMMKEAMMSGENAARTKFKDVIDPSLRNDYPFDLAFAMTELAMRCLAADPGSRPVMGEVLMSLTAIHDSSLDWDPSYAGNISSVLDGR